MKKQAALFVCFFVLASCKSKESFELIVYAEQDDELIEPVAALFEGETGIRVELVSGAAGEMAERMGTQKRPTGDVLWVGFLEAGGESLKNYLEPYVTSSEEAFFSGYRNKEGYATFFAVLPDVLMVNRDLTKNLHIEGYADLLQPALRGKIAMADPQKSKVAFIHLANMLYAMGSGNQESGWSYVEDFAKQLDNKLFDSSNAVFKAVASGKMAVGLVSEEEAARMAYAGGPIEVVYMEEGSAVEFEGLYIVKNAKNMANAKKFVDFVTSHRIQNLMANALNRRSVRSDIFSSVLPPLSSFAQIQLNPADIEANKRLWMQRFQSLAVPQS